MDAFLKHWAAKAKQTMLGDAFIRRMPILYARAYRVFKTLSQAPLEQRIEWTQARVQKVLRAALRTPYGKKIGSLKLEDWPLLEKDQVRDCPEAFLAAPKWRLVPASTSGTTGTPLRLYRSFECIAAEQAAIDFILSQVGLDFSKARIAVLRSDVVKSPDDLEPPYWRDEGGGRRRIFSSIHLSKTTFPYFIEALRAHRTECLYTRPTPLEFLLTLMDEHHEQLSIPYCLTSSEQPTLQIAPLVVQHLGARWIDYYGLAERNAFAYSLAPGEYRFLPGYGMVEFVPVENVEDGVLCEIIATGLWNCAMPLVRYRTGDLVLLPASETVQHLIAYGEASFSGVLGRRADYIIGPGGRPLIGISYIPRDIKHVARMQVIQESLTQVRILVLPLPGYSAADEAQILANARLKLPATMQVRVEVVEQLERTAQGKTPFVIRKV